MKQSIVYVGLDVDDTQYHGSAFATHTGVVVDFHCRPTLKGLCYASLRHSASIFLDARSGCVMKRPILVIPCNGIEPNRGIIVMWWPRRVSLPPRNKQIKTDRIDAAG